ncbi:hypothetical protein LTR36_005430 [Oleoguttula mirabilis]|uniref:Elongin-C n=1 Tax=Oleoguttula mirabilis TaxID=1507867 RepID=A0AAV9JEB7_9PEZI|nr:hypothetical protein LTR36_005430 [Oleoguttula mirabilis]
MASETDYVTLISKDGFSYVVQRSSARISPVLKRMLDPTGAFLEAKDNTCILQDMPGIVLEKVCEYFYYNEKNKDARDVPEMDIPTELCLELLMASDYLDI